VRAREEGLSLPEILVAALLIGIALVPLLELYPGTLGFNVETEVDSVLSAAAMRKMEEIITLLRPSGAIDSVVDGTEACSDLPNCRLTWTITTQLESTVTGVGKLKTLNVFACQDSNGNSVCEASERNVRYDAKITSRP
jgi:Tfp pilus assembly protein PilV